MNSCVLVCVRVPLPEAWLRDADERIMINSTSTIIEELPFGVADDVGTSSDDFFIFISVGGGCVDLKMMCEMASMMSRML